MTTVKEFAELVKTEMNNLFDALKNQKEAIENNPALEGNKWLFGAAYSLDHQVTDFLKRACDAVDADPNPVEPGVSVPDPPAESAPLTLSYQMYDPANGKKYKILLQEIV